MADPFSDAARERGIDASRAVPLMARGRWPQEIDVWHLRFDFAGAQPGEVPFLSAAERAKAARFLQLPDQIRSAATRSVLRELLGHYLKMNPADVPLVVASRGKPMLADSLDVALSFNVSHSGDHALIAISRRHAVGIDIERIDTTIDWRGLARLVCTPVEKQAIETAPPQLQAAQFFRCWTAKEALLKALGLGITDGLLALRVDPRTEAPPQVADGAYAFDGARAMNYRWIEDIDGYLGCLAFDIA
ncbi:4'-phosphopantetheinyl transferase [Paraburkholderia eburnea]|uniref:4'-phosphopantetheinyl transferase n=1 Tax=Paraburkholderia eburnea TaxID=1189126 RepID=A0A2S4MA06_9BURK|nr:4'-phosphopantetheinyl transferase superfamily protein [Paraburkholderia eburnea]POR51572.1 4'-phosphopantetheinyl transferase [Paraburkholderia eburnea]PRZ22603.1 4'-phosphopantetheinyl transferase [Paraburkholderia eburnea]